ncbi:MAG: hypothetical protein EZS28_006502 [Streblomastix strix]|uniref:Uncharacterized protein n=1 Tax=Streblomastix strix TaxID=222440 RepID=A0A5J4WTU2_9EUKA|nr:MAG: hypothetical protein EZS28_006502 [Streblomastix strix]
MLNSAVMTKCPHDLSISMELPLKKLMIQELTYFWTIPKFILVQQTCHATNTQIVHHLEPRSGPPSVATNALIKCKTQLSLIQIKLGKILEGISGAQLQKTDFFVTDMLKKQFQELIQRAAWVVQLFQRTEIPTADLQLQPPLCAIIALGEGLKLQAFVLQELGMLTIYYVFVGNLKEALTDTIPEQVLILRQAERANMARIRFFLKSTPIYLMEMITP